MLKKALLVLCLCACGGDDEVSTSSQAVGSGSAGSGSGSGLQERGDPCDETPIDAKGTLPACVAGRSTGKGPGRIKDTVLVPEEPPTPEVEEATRAANAQANARGGKPDSKPEDRGFAPLHEDTETP